MEKKEKNTEKKRRSSPKGGAMNLKVGGDQCIGRWGGQYCKNSEI